MSSSPYQLKCENVYYFFWELPLGYLNPNSNFRYEYNLWWTTLKLTIEKTLNVYVVITDVKGFQIARSIRFPFITRNISSQPCQDSAVKKRTFIWNLYFQFLFRFLKVFFCLPCCFLLFEIQYRTSKTETLGEISDLEFFACTVYLIAFGVFWTKVCSQLICCLLHGVFRQLASGCDIFRCW